LDCCVWLDDVLNVGVYSRLCHHEIPGNSKTFKMHEIIYTYTVGHLVFWNELVIWYKGIEFPPPTTIKQDAIPCIGYIVNISYYTVWQKKRYIKPIVGIIK
jgi:hypothetical protein